MGTAGLVFCASQRFDAGNMLLLVAIMYANRSVLKSIVQKSGILS